MLATNSYKFGRKFKKKIFLNKNNFRNNKHKTKMIKKKSWLLFKNCT